MKDYLVYHKAEKMGYPALDIENLAIYTSKPTAGAVGGRVWLVAGEGAPRKYYLRATFLIGGVHASEKPGFRSRVVGTDGRLFDPMPRLDAEAWFPSFVEEHGRFALGFSEIKNPHAIAGFRAIVAARPMA